MRSVLDASVAVKGFGKLAQTKLKSVGEEAAAAITHNMDHAWAAEAREHLREEPRIMTLATETLNAALLNVERAVAQLEPLAGGRSDGTRWTDSHAGSGADIMHHFKETSDLLEPAELEKRRTRVETNHNLF